MVLAAGEASRFGAPKQNLLLPRVLARVAQSALADVVVVEGAHSIDVALPPRVRLVECPLWAEGPGASLRCGLDALGPATGAALVVLADGPRLDPRAIRRVIDAWREGAGPVVAASYGGERSHPVLLDSSIWDDVPAGGARELEPELVDCSDLPHPGDIDTPEDLARLEKDLEA